MSSFVSTLPGAPQSLAGQVLYLLAGFVVFVALLVLRYPDRMIGTHSRKGTPPVSCLAMRHALHLLISSIADSSILPTHRSKSLDSARRVQAKEDLAHVSSLLELRKMHC